MFAPLMTAGAAVGAAATGAAAFDAGGISDFLLKGEVPAAPEIRDETGLASGAFAWDLEIPPGGAQSVVLDVPLHAGTPGASPPLTLSKKIFDDRLARASERWGRAVDRVRFRVPPSAQALVATLKSNLAFVLVNRDGPWIQPGSRAYERSWIRDGALTTSALLRLGHAGEVRDSRALALMPSTTTTGFRVRPPASRPSSTRARASRSTRRSR